MKLLDRNLQKSLIFGGLLHFFVKTGIIKGLVKFRYLEYGMATAHPMESFYYI